MHIRPYQDSDEAQVVALWHACELTRAWNDPHKDIARKLRVQRELFLVGSVGDLIVATVMAGYEGHRGWINYLAVEPAQRNQGHASALLQRVEALLLEAGCPKVSLQIRASNKQALAFYRHTGYLQDEVISFGKRLIPDEAAI
jgi:ribosomal protein S18 acetylase RimI-like enzyme